ncbi:hypothetical protein UVI_02010700 [Ustilaginoidea virens]|uniref:Uncharacterized protein n=1 Tax=Ustilaginoidea virens TaxID=1159556 RepID=A0A1B5KWK5_USTVR|nr:hypothetical protein UVI_02010700 [Ustilaginoidea virens]
MAELERLKAQNSEDSLRQQAGHQQPGFHHPVCSSFQADASLQRYGTATPDSPDPTSLAALHLDMDLHALPETELYSLQRHEHADISSWQNGTLPADHLAAQMPFGNGVGAATPRSPTHTEAFAQLFGRVMAEVEAAGYASLDAFLATYYARTFDASSPFAIPQQVSRGVGLPRLLADLVPLMCGSGACEDSGIYRDMAVTMAQQVLQMEVARTSGAVRARLDRFMELLEPEFGAVGVSASFAELSNLLQAEQPNTWALLHALAGARTGGLADPSTMTTMMLMLNCAGSMDKQASKDVFVSLMQLVK